MYNHDQMRAHKCDSYYDLLAALKDIVFQCRHLSPLRNSEAERVDLEQGIKVIAEADEGHGRAIANG